MISRDILLVALLFSLVCVGVAQSNIDIAPQKKPLQPVDNSSRSAQLKTSSSGSGLMGLLFSLLFFIPFIGFWFIWGIFMVVGFGGVILWIFMLIDCVKRDFEKESDKTTWILILALTNWIGGIIYYFMIYRKTGSSSIEEVAKRKLKAEIDRKNQSDYKM